MQISTNHVALLAIANRKGGLRLEHALEIDQRTLGSACLRTSGRNRLLDYNADLEAFVPTETGRWVLQHDIPRKAANTDSLSAGVAKIARRRGLRIAG